MREGLASPGHTPDPTPDPGRSDIRPSCCPSRRKQVWQLHEHGQERASLRRLGSSLPRPSQQADSSSIALRNHQVGTGPERSTSHRSSSETLQGTFPWQDPPHTHPRVDSPLPVGIAGEEGTGVVIRELCTVLGADWGAPWGSHRSPSSRLDREPALRRSLSWGHGQPGANCTDDRLPPPGGCGGHCGRLAAPWPGTAQRPQDQV